MRQATLDFNDLWDCLLGVNDGLLGFKEFLDKLVEDIYSLSIEYRVGNLTTEIIKDLKDTVIGAGKFLISDDNKDAEPSDSELALSRHGITIFSDFALLPSSYAAFFARGHLNEHESRQGLERSQYLSNDDTPSWQRLWYRMRLSDKEFIYFKNKVYREFRDIKYRTQEEIFHIVGIFLDLASEQLVTQTVQQMLKISKSVVDVLERRHLIDAGPRYGISRSHYTDTAAFGLGYFARNMPEFKEFKDYYRSRRDIVRNKAMQQWAKEWMTELSVDPVLWIKRITQEDNSMSWYLDQPIFKFGQPKKFTQLLLKLSPPHLLEVHSALHSRYEFVIAHQDIFKQELSFWIEVEKTLLIQLNFPSNMRLSRFIFKDIFMPELRKIIVNIAGC